MPISNLPQYPGFLFFISLVMGSCASDNQPDRSPEAEAASFSFADPELTLSLVASEPDIMSPVDMEWGPDGSLYVAEMPGYPVDKDLGSIKRLTDPDGDGFYDVVSTYRDDLNFPTGIMFYDGGLLVTDAPDILFLKDTDGDGVADHRKAVLTGFEPGNEQLRANALHWGLDNWIYGANGRSGGKVRFTDDTVVVSIENRDFRFNLTERAFEAISGMSQYGLARDDWGNRFISHNHRFARQVVLEERHLVRNPYLATRAVFDTYQDEHDRQVFTLLTETQRFNRDPIGYFTSLSGLTANRGHLMGEAYEGDLFAGESVQAAVIHRRMQENGVTFSALDTHEGTEFLRSPDEWFHPVNFTNGPDGAFYMVDFYRLFVEHPEWAYDELSEGIDWRIGDENGRIWRIVHQDAKADPARMQPNLDQASAVELVAQYEDPAGWRRDMAQQLLVHGQRMEAEPALIEMLGSDIDLARTHALWTLHGLGKLTNDQINGALNDASTAVQMQGILLATDRLSQAPELVTRIAELSGAADQALRFRAILALGAVNSPVVMEALNWAATQYEDKWTRVALLSSAARWAGQFSKELLVSRDGLEATAEDLQFYREVGSMLASVPTKPQNASWIRQIISDPDAGIDEAAFMAGYLEASGNLGRPLPALGDVFFSKAEAMARGTADTLAALLGVELLGYSRTKRVHDQLADLVLSSSPNKVKFMAVQAISTLNNAPLSSRLFDNLTAMDPVVRKELISSSVRSDAAAMSLLSAIEKEQVDLTEIPEELRYALMEHANEEIKERAVARIGSAVDGDRAALVERYVTALAQQTVDLENGAAVFKSHCTTCHAVNGEGGLLGPDLTNIGSRADDVLMMSILDPSRMVSYELKLHVVVTNSDEVFSGTLSAETVTSITIKQPDGKETTILRDNIKRHTETDQSIMPEGFERMIDEKSMADLIGFLRQPAIAGD